MPEGDALHPAANVAKMSAGTPLTDDDRLPWLKAIGARLAELTGAEWGMVASGCAAALTHATSACVAGGNPDLHIRIPNLSASEWHVADAQMPFAALRFGRPVRPASRGVCPHGASRAVDCSTVGQHRRRE